MAGGDVENINSLKERDWLDTIILVDFVIFLLTAEIETSKFVTLILLILINFSIVFILVIRKYIKKNEKLLQDLWTNYKRKLNERTERRIERERINLRNEMINRRDERIRNRNREKRLRYKLTRRVIENHPRTFNYSYSYYEKPEEKFNSNIDFQDSIPDCLICFRNINNDTPITCPYCSNSFHRKHLIEWLKYKSHCPNCRKYIDLNSVI